jgi:polyisoprenoid-binding protein YceI
MNARALTAPLLLLVSVLGVLPWSLTPAPTPSDTVDAKAGTYRVDGGHSSAWFGIRHLGVANFYGRFNSMEGEFVLDLDEPDNCRVKVSIDPDSVDTNSDGRDDHVKSPDFLDVENFALMGFESSSVAIAEDGTLKVTGKLNLHGKNQELTIDVKLVGAGDTAFRDYRCGMEATFTISRSDFGMDAMLDKLGDEITFTLSLEGILQP